MLSKRVFDYTKDGRTVTCYRITDKNGAYAEVLDYGGIVRALCVPGRTGALTDVVIGFDRLAPYIKNADAYYGAFVGRYANRIAGGKLNVDGVDYQLDLNNGENHLHGGTGSYSSRFGQLTSETEQSITLTWDSPDLDNNYPGHMTISVTYTFAANKLTLTYVGTTDKDTVFNPTNHSYFNMNGPDRASIGDNLVKLYGSRFTPVDKNCIPTGDSVKVRGAMNMRSWTRLADVLKKDSTDPNLIAGNGIDHNFVIDGYTGETGELNLAAELYGEETGIRMSVSTDLPGVQVYSGNYIPQNLKGKAGKVYGPRCAICFESQYYPDSVNHPDWPSPLLKAGETAEYSTVYAFDVPPKAVILDGFTAAKDDLTWEPVRKQCILEVYDRTAPEDIVKRAKGAEIVLTNKAVLTAEIIEKLPDLKYVGLLSTGANAVDLPALRSRGIACTNVPGYSTEDVAQLTFALILELCLNVQSHSDSVHNGGWTDCPDFCYALSPLQELSGSTLGIIGYGAIGSRVCEIARAFHMKVLVNSRTEKELPEGARFVSRNELLRKSDIVTLHCPLTEDTKNMIDAHALSLMKPAALLINTARGPLLDAQAVADALNNGELAGCAVDVLTKEPPEASDPLLSARNCLITPHIAWQAKDARVRLIDIVGRNITAFLAGRKLNRID